jgi:selenocysteine lyase/cysteine desulfurase
VVGPENASTFVTQETSPLYPEHRYVAQRYVWPPVLFGGRKCHVRVYGLLTSDGRAFVHHRAFLHVANDAFTTKDGSTAGSFQDSVHITNCCTNSDDDEKFAGEILADFEQTESTTRDGQPVVPLAQFFPSIKACISTLAKRVFPFLQGGQANHGFEYLGTDFMLSYNDDGKPVAYILEVNAPPSQDTATGLPHAENLHDDVLRDLSTIWVLPHVTGSVEVPGGWRCVHDEEVPSEREETPIIPSKAAILNMIRWAMYEKKALRMEQQKKDKDSKSEQSNDNENGTQEQDNAKALQSERISTFARAQFPYFSDAQLRCPSQVFFENAGGSQVAQSVIDAVTSSLTYRHRSIVGTKTKAAARETFQKILGAMDDSVFVGPNASSLLATLATLYVEFGLLTSSDEVVISTENHVANFEPWVKAAKACGARVKLWTPFANDDGNSSHDMESSTNISDLITTSTRIVALPHASNILGQVRDIANLTRIIKAQSQGHAHVVVDGVAAAPHWFSAVDELRVDWYVVSCHKLFGPHLGGLCGRRGWAVEQLSAAAGSPSGGDDSVYRMFEKGTVNYEACAGVVGMGQYLGSLASFPLEACTAPAGLEIVPTAFRQRSPSGEACAEGSACMSPTQSSGDITKDVVLADAVREAYRRIRIAETPLVNALLGGLRRSQKVRVIEGSTNDLACVVRLPTVCFVHGELDVRRLHVACEASGILCRYSAFLCTEHLARDFGFDHSEGILRVSLAHYNTVQEIDLLLRALEALPGWF